MCVGECAHAFDPCRWDIEGAWDCFGSHSSAHTMDSLQSFMDLPGG